MSDENYALFVIMLYLSISVSRIENMPHIITFLVDFTNIFTNNCTDTKF